jgi:hypothetical protein
MQENYTFKITLPFTFPGLLNFYAAAASLRFNYANAKSGQFLFSNISCVYTASIKKQKLYKKL